MMYRRVFTITSLLVIILGRVELHRHRTMLNFNVEESWLTTAEFAKYLQLALNRSRCVNVYIHGTSETTITHFKNFMKIYPNTYIVGHKLAECTGFLMISTTVTGLGVTIKFVGKIPRIEMLIIVDESVNASSELLDPEKYGNANAKIMSPNGTWCLPKHYLSKRVFKENCSFEELKYDTGIANLQGRNLKTGAYDDPPHVFMSIDKTVNGDGAESSTDNKNPELDGVNLKLFTMIIEQLNATYRMKTFNDADRDDGKFWLPSIVNLVLRNTLDIGITKEHRVLSGSLAKYLTTPLGVNHVHFLVPRPKLRATFWAPVTPFTAIVWILIIIMLITQSLFVYTKARLFPTRVSKKFESFAMTWIELMGRLLNTTAPKMILGFKITFHLWSLASILLLTAYSSDLASKLTSPSYEKRIDTPKDFITANLSWGSGTSNFLFYFRETDPYYKEIMSRHVMNAGDESERHEKILKGNYAILGTVIGNVFFPHDRVASADLKGYRLMKQAISSSYTSFLVQPWLQESVNKIILSLSEGGFVNYHKRHVISRHADSALREVMSEREDEGPQVLSLKPLSMCFGFLILGLLISTIVFIHEVLSFTGPQNSVSQVFADLKKNRQIANFREKKKNRVFRRLKLKR